MAIDRMRGAIPFPAAGEGIAIRFLAADMADLQTAFGDNWFIDANARMDRTDIAFISKCLEVGPKDSDGKRVKVAIDDLGGTVAEIAQPLLDGLYVAVFGRTFTEHVAYVAERLGSLGDQSPLSSPENSSII